MRAWSVIVRELRAEARHGFTYWLRVLGAGVLVLFVGIAWESLKTEPSAGALLYRTLYSLLFLLLWVFVPLTIADCISREKRQGTLGLLFLTPLKPGDIVLAKALAHGLRSLTFFVAAVPVLTISLLLGGVSWESVVFSLMILGSAFSCALGVGLLASACSQRWTRALALALVLSAFSLLAFTFLMGVASLPALGGLAEFRWPPTPGHLLELFQLGLIFCYSCAGTAVTTFFSGKIPTLVLFVTLLCTLSLSLLFLRVCVFLAAHQIRRSWRQKSPSAFAAWFNEVFCKPKFLLPLYRKFMRRKIEKNPIGWLQRRTWSGRTVAWSWLAIVILVYTFLATGAGWRVVKSGQSILGYGLLISIAAAAAASFQRERETGLLELVLVTPLKASNIIIGRLRGIWGQFLLVFLLWLFIAVAFVNFDTGRIPFIVCGFLSLPVIGLYYSLRRRHFMTSLGWTGVVGFFLPAHLGWLLENRGRDESMMTWLLTGLDINSSTIAVQIGIVGWVAYRLHSNLAERKFVVDRRE